MTRRPPGPGVPSRRKGVPKLDDGEIDEIADPDLIVNVPKWSRSLLVLLDYAIVEGVKHRQHAFVHYLKLAEAELTKVSSEGVADEDAESDREKPPSLKVH